MSLKVVEMRDCRVAVLSPAPRNDSRVSFPPLDVLSSRGAKPRCDLVVYPRIAAAALALALGITVSGAAPNGQQQARLVARSVLPAMTFRAGSPATGAFFSASDREAARANGIPGPSEGPYFPSQPVQGFSSMIPADGKTWWALADNGYAWRPNSGDFQLSMVRIDPRWGEAGGPKVLETILFRDPDHHIPWTILCDRASGKALPPFSFNAMPPAPAACGGDPKARILTGFDLDPESFVRAPDGTFWISEEFGPFLVHVGADGTVLEAPIAFPGVASPQNPFLKYTDRAQAVNDRQMLIIERDNLGDDQAAPRFKKVFLIDLSQAAARGGYVGKTLLLDLLAIPDPAGVGGDGDFFRMPFYTIESVHVVDERTLLIASDNNFPFSHGRARSRRADRSGSLVADDTEFILVRLGTPLDVDRRLLPSAGH